METSYIVGLDLGQAKDFSALAVLEQTREKPESSATYAVRELRRWPLGTSYPSIVEDVTTLCGTAPLTDCTLVIDGTGVGRPVVDLFQLGSIQAAVTPVLITAGHTAQLAEDGYQHVPKRDLAGVLQVLLGNRRLKVAKRLALAKTTEKELASFQVKISVAGNETFQADWREGTHDDLVLAVALAAWFGENVFTGAWRVGHQPGARSIVDMAPEGVFLDVERDPYLPRED